jgi:hypothetical protein
MSAVPLVDRCARGQDPPHIVRNSWDYQVWTLPALAHVPSGISTPWTSIIA